MKKDKGTILTVIGMVTMIILTVIKTAASSQPAAYALIAAGIAFFFIVETAEKTPDAESGLSFRRFYPDLKKTGVIPLILFMAVLTVLELFLDKLLFGNELIGHVLGRASIMTETSLITVLVSQILAVLGEEIGFRGFFLGKGMKLMPFRPAALLSAAVFAVAHFSAGPGAVVICDLVQIFIDAVLYAVLYRKTGNCLISCIPHFAGNMIGYFLMPLLFA